jgi:hypothetical protein
VQGSLCLVEEAAYLGDCFVLIALEVVQELTPREVESMRSRRPAGVIRCCPARYLR